MDTKFIIMCVVWLGGGNLIVILSLKRQGLPWYQMFSPNVLTKIQGRDWGAILALAVLTMSLAAYLPR